MNPITLDTGEQLDPKAVKLMRAIRQKESGGNYDAIGDAGTSTGAFQFQDNTWKGWAKEILGDENAVKDKANQNKVAYTKIKQWKDQGFTPEQVAAAWNAGEQKARDGSWRTNKGHNASIGLDYDTPSYVNDVIKIAKGSNAEFNPTPFSKPADTSKFKINTSGVVPEEKPQEQKEETLGGMLGNRIKDASQAISNTTSGKINPISGLIQTVGSAAGAIGDVTGKALGLIPGFKKLEGLIGSGVEKLANTESGKAVAKSIEEFSKEHPELSDDIGAGFNIVTAIPILKGLAVAKNATLDAASSALKGAAEKSMTKSLTETLDRTIGGRTVLKDTPQTVKTLINERAIPDITDNRYNTKEAFEKLSNSISNIEDTQLQPALKKVSTSQIADKQPIESLRQQALANVEQEFKATGQVSKAKSEINRIFDDYRSSYGDYVSLEDVNDMKRGVRKSVNFNSPKLDSDVSYHLGQTFQKNIEDAATVLGLGDVKAINQSMADLIKAQKTLKYIEGKSIKSGLVGGFVKNSATVGGEMLGEASGVPIAGALAGRNTGRSLGNKLTGGVEGILKRTGKNATRTSKQEIKKGVKGLVGGTLIQSRGDRP